MDQASAQPTAHHHAPPQGFIRKYVFSLDHKVIGLQYYGLALIAVVTGMVLSWFMRIHLAWGSAAIPLLDKLSPNGAPGGVITPEYYLSLMTMHGTIMVFFVLTNAPFAGFGNYFLPIQIGAEDMAFPRFNMMSFWTTFAAFLVLITAFFVADGPPISGWTAYAPLSAVGKDSGPGEGLGQSLWGISIALFCHRPASWVAEFYRHDARPPHQGYDAGANAAVDLGVVHHGVHRLAGVRRIVSRLHSSNPRPICRDELFCSRGAGYQRQAATTFRWLTAPLATPVLVLRPPGGLYRHPAGDRDHFAHPADVHAQAAPRRNARCHRMHDRYRLPQLHGLGTSHVPERHESFFSAAVFMPTLIITIPATIATLVWLARSTVPISALPLRALLPGLHLRVHQRRHQRVFPGAAIH